ncbi:MAG: NAD(P)/FAD-dependent oxidoreductase [Sulfuricaulis sp.]|nr:NAD(P)/FAD-dependent oxidoreductase [Sulfuricaulis sp.]
MSEQTYDVIVIGAGENGLVLGNYLGKAGLKVLVCERRLESGGGLSTEEPTVIGSWHNTGAFYHDSVDITPVYKDLDLENFNTVYLHPPVQSSVVRSDGESLTVFSDLERTCSEIARWSKEDAATWRRHCRTFQSALATKYRPYLLNPARKAMGLEDFDSRAAMTPLQAVQTDFKHPLTQAMLLSHFMVPRGILADDPGAGRFLQLVAATAGQARIVEGGSHELAQSLWTAQLRNNGWVWDSTPVKRILVEEGKAVGVETASGRILRSRVVVSTVDLKTTFLSLLDKQDVPADLVKGINDYRMAAFSLFVIHAALNDAPQLQAKDAQAGKALRWTFGLDTPEAVQEHVAQIRRGELPGRLGAMVSAPSLHDPSQARPGKHTLLVWQLVPARLKNARWEDVAPAYTRQVLGWIAEYLPNVSGGNFMLTNTMTPHDFLVKWNLPQGAVFGGESAGAQLGATRPLPQLADFRTPIKNLYLGGSCMHPGAGIEGASGYIAARVIAADLGIKMKG